MKNFYSIIFCFLFLFFTRDAQGASNSPGGDIVIEAVETKRTLEFFPEMESWAPSKHVVSIEYTVLLENQEVFNLLLYKTFWGEANQGEAKKSAESYFNTFIIVPGDVIQLQGSGIGVFVDYFEKQELLGISVTIERLNMFMSGYTDNIKYFFPDYKQRY